MRIGSPTNMKTVGISAYLASNRANLYCRVQILCAVDEQIQQCESRTLAAQPSFFCRRKTRRIPSCRGVRKFQRY